MIPDNKAIRKSLRKLRKDIIKSNIIKITRCDIERGYKIRCSGTYCIEENAVFDPRHNPVEYNAVQFSGGNGMASGFAVVSGGVVRGVIITNGGSNYTAASTVTFPHKGSGAAGQVIVASGVITGVNVTSGGFGYKNTVQAAITILAPNVTVLFKTYTVT